MEQSGHLNPSEETRTGCPVTLKYGKTPPIKHEHVGRQQQHDDNIFLYKTNCINICHVEDYMI